MKRVPFALPALLGLGLVGVLGWSVWNRTHPAGNAARDGVATTAAAVPGVIRLSGTVEATRARTVLVPRLAGQSTPTIVITRLVAPGATVREGDVIVEFDRQEQLRIARDKRAELVDLDGQIQKKKSDQAIARGADETALKEAENNVGRAELDARKNEFVSKVEAEKNDLAVEQAKARFNQLKATFDLKRKAAEADLKTLEIKRARAELAQRYAEGNAELMSVKAPFSGLVVLKQVWKGESQAPVAEGEEVRPGLPILDIVDASAMQVRALVNQADIGLVTPGRTARVRLDAYPQLQFDGRVELVAPLGVASSLTPKVHSFTAIISILGSDPQLMPDLTASVEVAADVVAAAAPAPAAVAAARAGGR
jgi:multidrug resistance efflux pump